MRIFCLISGVLCLILGAVGAFLPLIPTVPLWLLAAFFFARSSERLHNWLIRHPVMGAAIRDWNEHGAIGHKAKLYATVSILTVLLISIVLNAPVVIIGLQMVILTAVLIFIWTRPSR